MKTQRLHLQEVRQSDIDHIYKGLSHPDVIKYYGVSYTTLEETQEQMSWYKDLVASQRGIWWCVRQAESGTFVGAGGFNGWNHEHAKAEIGFWLLPNFWGLGYMKEAMSEMLNYGFCVMKLNRVEGFVEASNMNCKRAIEKIGLSMEGTMRETEKKAGNFIDVDIYRILKREWEQKMHKICK